MPPCGCARTQPGPATRDPPVTATPRRWALLDIVAAELPHLDSGVRWQVVESCRVLLGEQVASPAIRRTRLR